MTLRQFLKEASNIKDELLDKEVVIRAENGILLDPKIKFILKEGNTVGLTDKTVDKAIITF